VLVDRCGLLDPSGSAVGFMSNDLHPIPVNDVVHPCHMICDGGRKTSAGVRMSI